MIQKAKSLLSCMSVSEKIAENNVYINRLLGHCCIYAYMCIWLYVYIYIYIYVLGAQMTSIFEGQPSKGKAKIPIKTRVIWVPGI